MTNIRNYNIENNMGTTLIYYNTLLILMNTILAITSLKELNKNIL